MPAKRKAVKRKPAKRKVVRRRKVQHGEGFFDVVWCGLNSVGNFVKDNKLISTFGSMLPGPYGQVGRVAGQLGFGNVPLGIRNHHMMLQRF